MNWDVQFRYLTELATGILAEREFSLGVLGIDFESGDFLNFQINMSSSITLSRSWMASTSTPGATRPGGTRFEPERLDDGESLFSGFST